VPGKKSGAVLDFGKRAEDYGRKRWTKLEILYESQLSEYSKILLKVPRLKKSIEVYESPKAADTLQHCYQAAAKHSSPEQRQPMLFSEHQGHILPNHTT